MQNTAVKYPMRFQFLLFLQTFFLFCTSCLGYANEIAITFDDLPESTDCLIAEQRQINQRILNTLITFKAPAIGFVNEAKLYSNTKDSQAKIALLKLWVDKGFELGNHTFSHASLHTLNLEQFSAEVNKGSTVSKKLMRNAGKAYHYFRHPYLHTGTTPKTRAVFENFLKEKNYIVAPVTIDTDDWKFDQQLRAHPENKNKIIESYLLHTRAKFAFYEQATKKIFGRNIKQIWLLHANLINSYSIERLLKVAKEYHYDFISLDNALSDDVYKSVDNYYAPFGVSWLYRWDFTRGKVVDWSKDPEPDNNPFITTTRLELFDKTRKRAIPVVLYVSDESQGKADAGIIKLPVAIINHGYTIKNTEYSFLANALAASGYFVVSIQHDLPTDPPLAKIGNIFERRKPLWERGSDNIFYVMKALSRTKSHVDFTKATLIGHSNGGDIALFFASIHPELAAKIISLDNLRMPFPKSGQSPILSIRANDTKADFGVLPTPETQKKLAITITPIHEAKHIDLCDRGSPALQQTINKLVLKFLNKKI